MHDLSRVSICGVGIDPLHLEDLVEMVLHERHTPKYRYIVTPNAQHLVHINKSWEEIAQVYSRAFLCVNDSRVISRLSAVFFRYTLPACPGSDLTRAVLGRLNQEFDTISIIGMQESYLPRLRQIYPKLNIHHYNPPMGFIDNEAEVARCLDFLISNPASIIFFAVGFPRQEVLAARFGAVKGARGMGLCIGASLDFVVGAQVRAPNLLQKAGLEWAFRLLRDPRRLARRYLIESPQVVYFLWKHRNHTRASIRRRAPIP